MIEKNEIDTMAVSLNVPPSYVQRDYVHGWILSSLYSNSSLSDRLVLKGGNCLRKGYFENARYSRDIDFTTSARISNEEIDRELNAIVSALEDRAGIRFDTSRTIVNDKKRADVDKEISEARLYFRDFYGNENEIVIGVRLDVTQFDRVYLPIQERTLIHPYSDAGACEARIRCVKLEEILATKMRCLLQRKHIADLFDLVYATIISPEIDIDRREIIETFFKITIFGSRPSVAKGLFLDLPVDKLGSLWSRYISCPGSSWFEFDQAKETLFSLIDGLIPGAAEHHYDRTFFPSSLRNPILEAADSKVMLQLVYDGVSRLIEPYELSFKIRKDGVGREYLYAYDTVGGRSSGPGLKSFLPGKIQALELTEESFKPRYDIETNRAGGAETVSWFTNRRAPVSRRRSRTSTSGWNTGYQIECPYCGKRFKRKTRNTKLNKHKDKYGDPCSGRTGFIV